MKRLPPLLFLLAALLLPAFPAPADTPASQPLAPKVFTPAAPAPPPAFTPAGQAPQVVAGPPGPAGQPGLPGAAGAPGSPGQPGAGVGYSAALSGVVANTAADQAPAIATALTASKATGLNSVALPPGVMTLQSPIAITATGFDGGTRLIGAGINAQLASPRGTTLLMGAANQEAVVRVGSGFMVGGEISDLTLGGHGPPTALDTQYGVYFAETNWTNWLLHRLYIQNVQTAIAVTYHTGNANGENLLIEQTLAGNVKNWYRNDSGQAYAHTEIASGAGLLESVSATNYSTAYQLMGGPLGLGQNFLSLHGSSSFATAVNNPLSRYNTFLEDQGADQATFLGLRMEHCGTIIKIAGGTPQKVGAISISNAHFTDMVDGSVIVQATSVNGQFGITISDTEFDSPTWGGGTAPTATLNILQALAGDPNAHITFVRCRFCGFKTINLGAAPTAGHYTGCLYNDCWQAGTAITALSAVSNLSSTGTPVASITN